jgi:hypothetical protein
MPSPLSSSTNEHLGDVLPPSSQPHTSLLQDLWSYLRALDPVLQVPDTDTVGSSRGDRFQLQWWAAEVGQHFALQALDIHHGQQWEAFAIPASAERTVAGVRSNWATAQAMPATDDIWTTVFMSRVGPLTEACRHPSFVEIVSTASNPAGINVLRDDHARLDQLQSDLEYWKGLAKAQEKSVRKEMALQRRQPSSPQIQAPAASEPTIDATWKLRDIDRWAAQNTDRIIVLPRAISATKNSTYDAPEVLYRALELLANEYTQMRQGTIDMGTFKDKAREIGVELNRSVAPESASAYGDQYFVRWAGSRRLLDQHLTKGVSRDPRYCLRIYFFFDETSGQVVVGSMPDHLDTAGT